MKYNHTAVLLNHTMLCGGGGSFFRLGGGRGWGIGRGGGGHTMMLAAACMTNAEACSNCAVHAQTQQLLTCRMMITGHAWESRACGYTPLQQIPIQLFQASLYAAVRTCCVAQTVPHEKTRHKETHLSIWQQPHPPQSPHHMYY